MLKNYEVIAQNAIRITREDGKVIYFDPFKITAEYKNDADFIFITHSHFDHFSPEDILKIKKDNTKIIAPEDLKAEIEKLDMNDYLLVSPTNQYTIEDITFSAVPAYNKNKQFHKKEYNWVGYVVNIDSTLVYVAGDTDDVEELHNIKCDIAFVPVGGTYTMNSEEAVELIKKIRPSLAIPTHYKTVVGSDKDAKKFQELLKGEVETQIIMK